MSSSATRMMLRKGKGDERTAKLQDSPDMPEAEATYCLKSGLVLSCSVLDHALTSVAAGKVSARPGQKSHHLTQPDI